MTDFSKHSAAISYSFLPDSDVILPICDDEYFDDDIELERSRDNASTPVGRVKLGKKLVAIEAQAKELCEYEEKFITSLAR